MLITSANRGCESDTSTPCALFVTIRQAAPLELFEDLAARHLLEEVETELARDREELDDFALVVAQTREALGDEQLERRRRVNERPREVPHAVALDEVARVAR